MTEQQKVETGKWEWFQKKKQTSSRSTPTFKIVNGQLFEYFRCMFKWKNLSIAVPSICQRPKPKNTEPHPTQTNRSKRKRDDDSLSLSTVTCEFPKCVIKHTIKTPLVAFDGKIFCQEHVQFRQKQRILKPFQRRRRVGEVLAFTARDLATKDSTEESAHKMVAAYNQSIHSNISTHTDTDRNTKDEKTDEKRSTAAAAVSIYAQYPKAPLQVLYAPLAKKKWGKWESTLAPAGTVLLYAVREWKAKLTKTGLSCEYYPELSSANHGPLVSVDTGLAHTASSSHQYDLGNQVIEPWSWSGEEKKDELSADWSAMRAFIHQHSEACSTQYEYLCSNPKWAHSLDLARFLKYSELVHLRGYAIVDPRAVQPTSPSSSAGTSVSAVSLTQSQRNPTSRTRLVPPVAYRILQGRQYERWVSSTDAFRDVQKRKNEGQSFQICALVGKSHIDMQTWTERDWMACFQSEKDHIHSEFFFAAMLCIQNPCDYPWNRSVWNWDAFPILRIPQSK